MPANSKRLILTDARKAFILEPMEDRLLLSGVLDAAPLAAPAAVFAPAAVVSSQIAAKLAFIRAPGNITAGNPFSPTVQVAVQDKDGKTVVGDSSSVKFDVWPDGAPNSVDSVDVAVVNGVATLPAAALSLTRNFAGTYSMKVSDGALIGATSNAYKVTAAARTQIVFKRQPTDITAGAMMPLGPAVAVEDRFGNIVRTDLSVVQMSLYKQDPVSGAYNWVAALGSVPVAAGVGVATLSPGAVAPTAAGKYYLQAIDGSLGPIMSRVFTVAVAAPAKLAFVRQPADLIAGKPMTLPPQIAVQDAFGNTILGDTRSVQVSLCVGSWAPPLASMSVVANNGLITLPADAFATLLTGAGKLYFQATSGSFTAVSNSFNVTAAQAAKLEVIRQPTNVVAGEQMKLGPAIAVEDQFGNIVRSDTSTVAVEVWYQPQGAAQATKLKTLAVAVSPGIGVAVVAPFDLRLNGTGTYFLKASDGGMTATSQVFTVTAATVAKIVFLQQPTDTPAGSPLNPYPAVAFIDGFGNVVTGNTSEVRMTLYQGSQWQSSVGINAVNGVATLKNFVPTLKAGTYVIQAQAGGLQQNSVTFRVTAAVAAQLVFTQQPTNVTAGAPMNAVRVEIRDVNGNLCTADNSFLSLTAVGPGPLNGQVPLVVAASGGVATFNSVSLNVAGSYQLQVSGAGPLSAVSGTFSVTPSASAKLEFILGTNAVVAGTRNRYQIAIKDAYGNLVTGDNSYVSLAVVGPGHLGLDFGGPQATIRVQAIGGIADFGYVRMTQAGQNTLKASDASMSATYTVQVTPDVPAKLAISGMPLALTSGQSFDFKVYVQDTWGNVITTDNSLISVGLHPGAANPFARFNGTKSVRAVNGVATFSGMSLDLQAIGFIYNIDANDAALKLNATSLNIVLANPAWVAAWWLGGFPLPPIPF